MAMKNEFIRKTLIILFFYFTEALFTMLFHAKKNSFEAQYQEMSIIYLPYRKHVIHNNLNWIVCSFCTIKIIAQ